MQKRLPGLCRTVAFLVALVTFACSQSADLPKPKELIATISQSADSPKPKEPVATIGGQPIYEDELLPRVQADLARLHNQEYEIRYGALQNLILEKLLRAEAQKRGISVEQLLEQVTSKAAEPAGEEVEAQYARQKDMLKGKPEEAKAQIRKSLKESKIRQARQEYFSQLFEAAHVSILLQPPRVDVSYDRGRLRGNPAAPVVIVEFSDFQCPFCRRAWPTLRGLLDKYKGQVSLAYRDFPLREIHEQAELAAEASRCAGEQGKFWEYHDLLFGQTSSLARDALVADAQGLGLDQKRFGACLESGKYKAAVEEDFQAGERAGVSGTPGFFINGVFLEGARPPADFEKIIDAELKRRK